VFFFLRHNKIIGYICAPLALVAELVDLSADRQAR